MWSSIARAGAPPQVRLTGGAAKAATELGITEWRLSISHAGAMAMASAIAIGVTPHGEGSERGLIGPGRAEIIYAALVEIDRDPPAACGQDGAPHLEALQDCRSQSPVVHWLTSRCEVISLIVRRSWKSSMLTPSSM